MALFRTISWLPAAIALSMLTAVAVRAQVETLSGEVLSSTQNSLNGWDEAVYLFGGKRGQAAVIRLSPDNSSCYFNLLPPEATDALFNGSRDGHKYIGFLSVDGVYSVQVYLSQGAAGRNERCNFLLTFQLTD